MPILEEKVMRKRMSFVRPVVYLTVILGFNLLALAGDINPPPGPIGPTMKTLTEVEPRVPVQSLPGSDTAVHVISEPGSYYLTANITGVSGRNGIILSASNITLDLNGYTLIGLPGTLFGIALEPGFQGAFIGITIRNGVVRDWGHGGLVLRGSGAADGAIVARVQALNNGSDTQHPAEGYGFRLANNSLIINCTAFGNAQHGFSFQASAGSNVIGCVAANNGQDGFHGSTAMTFSQCTARENGGDGIEAGNSLLRGNICVSNGGANINATDSTVVNNHAL